MPTEDIIADQVRWILQDLSISYGQINLAEIQGVANQTWICDDVVVRISKAPQYLSDLFTESVAAPAAFAAGVPSPEPIHFCLEECAGIPPYSVYRRAFGRPLSLTTKLSNPDHFFAEYGHALRLMRDQLRSTEDPNRYLDQPWQLDPEQLVKVGTSFSIGSTVQKLIEIGFRASEPPVFVHQDLHADNVLVSESETPVFIDWGDAGFGDATADFRFVPAKFLGKAVESYGIDSDPFLARIVLHQIDQCDYAARNQRSYGLYGDSQLPEILAVAERWDLLR